VARELALHSQHLVRGRPVLEIEHDGRGLRVGHCEIRSPRRAADPVEVGHHRDCHRAAPRRAAEQDDLPIGAAAITGAAVGEHELCHRHLVAADVGGARGDVTEGGPLAGRTTASPRQIGKIPDAVAEHGQRRLGTRDVNFDQPVPIAPAPVNAGHGAVEGAQPLAYAAVADHGQPGPEPGRRRGHSGLSSVRHAVAVTVTVVRRQVLGVVGDPIPIPVGAHLDPGRAGHSEHRGVDGVVTFGLHHELAVPDRDASIAEPDGRSVHRVAGRVEGGSGEGDGVSHLGSGLGRAQLDASHRRRCHQHRDRRLETVGDRRHRVLAHHGGVVDGPARTFHQAAGARRPRHLGVHRTP